MVSVYKRQSGLHNRALGKQGVIVNLMYVIVNQIVNQGGDKLSPTSNYRSWRKSRWLLGFNSVHSPKGESFEKARDTSSAYESGIAHWYFYICGGMNR